MDIQKAFGMAVRLKRTELSMSQETLALAAGKARSFVSAVERGTTAASLTSMWELANALETKPSDLWRDAERLYESTPRSMRRDNGKELPSNKPG